MPPCLLRSINTLKPKNSLSLTRTKAWMYVEASLASDYMRSTSPQTARHLLKQVKTAAFSREVSGAMLANAYMHVLPDRHLSRPATQKNRAVANGGFASVIDYNLTGARMETAQGSIEVAMGCAAEALAMYLMSRPYVTADQFLHPASAREEDSGGDLSRYNHDAYQMFMNTEGAYGKHPLQFKLSRPVEGVSPGVLQTYTEAADSKYDVPVLRLYPILVPVMEAIGTDSVEDIMQFAITESREGVGYYEETALDFATFSLQNAINTERYRTLLAGSRTPLGPSDIET